VHGLSQWTNYAWRQCLFHQPTDTPTWVSHSKGGLVNNRLDSGLDDVCVPAMPAAVSFQWLFAGWWLVAAAFEHVQCVASAAVERLFSWWSSLRSVVVKTQQWKFRDDGVFTCIKLISYVITAKEWLTDILRSCECSSFTVNFEHFITVLSSLTVITNIVFNHDEVSRNEAIGIGLSRPTLQCQENEEISAKV